jgi:ABC-type branched-subunit amino acid transport system substrate-binding protein
VRAARATGFFELFMKKEDIMGSKRFWMVLGMAACAVLLAAAPGLAAKPGFDDKEIRIAQWGPQTGPAAPWGNVARGSRLLFDLVNEEGGIHGRKIKYFIRDDQYNPAQTVAVVKDVVEREGIFAFVGGTSGASGLAVKDYLAANKVVWVSPATSIKEYVMPVNPYIFALMPLYDDEASILTKYVVEKLKIRKIGVLYQNDPYGKNGLNGVKQRLAHLKIAAGGRFRSRRARRTWRPRS